MLVETREGNVYKLALIHGTSEVPRGDLTQATMGTGAVDPEDIPLVRTDVGTVLRFRLNFDATAVTLHYNPATRRSNERRVQLVPGRVVEWRVADAGTYDVKLTAEAPYTASDGATGRSSLIFLFRLDAPVSIPNVRPSSCVGPTLRYANRRYDRVQLSRHRRALGLRLRRSRIRATLTEYPSCGSPRPPCVVGEPCVTPMPPAPVRKRVTISLFRTISPTVAVADHRDPRVVYVAARGCMRYAENERVLVRCLRRASKPPR